MKANALFLLGGLLAGIRAACTKDACYKHVAVSRAGGPNLSRRLADCSSILKSVIDDGVTRTTTITSTAPPTTTTSSETLSITTTTTTTTSYLRGVPTARRRSVAEEELVAVLEVRDKIVIKGNKPAYATSCAENQDYGMHYTTQIIICTSLNG